MLVNITNAYWSAIRLPEVDSLSACGLIDYTVLPQKFLLVALHLDNYDGYYKLVHDVSL